MKEKLYIERLEKMDLRLNTLFGTPALVVEPTIYLDGKHYETIAVIYNINVSRLKNVMTRSSLPNGKGFILFTRKDIENLILFDVGAIELDITSKYIYPYIHFTYHEDYKNHGLKKLNSIAHTGEIGVYINDYYYESIGNIYDPLPNIELSPSIAEPVLLFTRDDIKDLYKSNVEAVELIMSDSERLFVITHCIEKSI